MKTEAFSSPDKGLRYFCSDEILRHNFHSVSVGFEFPVLKGTVAVPCGQRRISFGAFRFWCFVWRWNILKTWTRKRVHGPKLKPRRDISENDGLHFIYLKSTPLNTRGYLRSIWRIYYEKAQGNGYLSRKIEGFTPDQHTHNPLRQNVISV